MPAKSKRSQGGPRKSDTETFKPQPPNWPTLRPILPASGVNVEEILPDQILEISKLFTINLCKTYVSFLASLPLSLTPGIPKKGEAVRVNDRFQVNDPVFARRLWSETALEEIITSTGSEDTWGGKVLGLNANIRVYRYQPGHYFDQHIDESNLVTSYDGQPGRTTWTLLIYLTDCEGGETAFYPEPNSRNAPTPEPILVNPRVGSALLHRHYPDCMLHEGCEVKNGTKWVLRSDLVIAR